MRFCWLLLVVLVLVPWSQGGAQLPLPGEVSVPEAAGMEAGEYFFDEDPGRGLGMRLEVGEDEQAEFSAALSIDVSDLTPGRHHLFVRFRDTEGRWGPVTKMPFFLLPQAVRETPATVAGEVEIEDRVGKVVRTDLALEGSANVSAVAQFSTEGWEPGASRVRVRLQDAQGQWSVPTTQTVFTLPSFPEAQIGLRVRQGEGDVLEEIPPVGFDEIAANDGALVFRPSALPSSGEVVLETVVLIDGRVEWRPLQSVLTVVSKDPPRLTMSFDAVSGEISLSAQNVAGGTQLVIEQSEDMKVWTEVEAFDEGQEVSIPKDEMPRFFRARVLSEAP